ncbi:MAG: endonuclease III [Firmicutes bacterium]|nr:endonuclease III [Bacillota bacterium]
MPLPDSEFVRQELVTLSDLLALLYPGDPADPLLFPTPLWAARDPIDLLVAAILSQATSDRNSKRAMECLKHAFPGWKEAAAAPVRKLAAVIASGGLADTKAPRIQAVLRALNLHEGGELDFLHGLSIEDAFKFLTGLPGVGPKTAACLLLFGFGRPVFPVDTHILRILRRLGLLPVKLDASKAQALLSGLIPPENVLGLHLRLIEHGRRVCRSRNPLCHSCGLAARCRRQL